MFNKILLLIFSFTLPLLIGFGAGRLSAESSLIYNDFKLPPLAPPSYVFGIAWTIIYILMGLSCFLIFVANINKKKKKVALIYYFLQLTVNFFWTLIFFNLNFKLFAFIWILLLVFLLIKTMAAFLQIDKIAFYLLIPYILWLLFASYLNLALYVLNDIY